MFYRFFPCPVSRRKITPSCSTRHESGIAYCIRYLPTSVELLVSVAPLPPFPYDYDAPFKLLYNTARCDVDRYTYDFIMWIWKTCSCNIWDVFLVKIYTYMFLKKEDYANFLSQTLFFLEIL